MSSLTPSHHQGASSGTFRINISCDKPASSLCTESTEPAKRFDCMVQNYFGLNFWGFLLSFRVADWAQNHCKKNLSRLLWFSCTFTDTFIERRIYFIKYLYSSTWSVKKKKKKKSFYQNDTKCNREYISQIYWDIFWSNLIKSLFRMPSKGDGKAWTH